jgi:iron complex outermembrane receptor protein
VSEFKGLGFGVGTIYNGQSWAGDPTTTVYYRLSGYVRWDTSVYYKWKHYNFSLNCQNVFDKRYISGAQSANTLNVGEQRKLIFSLDRRF